MSGELVDESPYSRKPARPLFGHFMEGLIRRARSVPAWLVEATLFGEYFNRTQIIQGDDLALSAFRQAASLFSLGLPDSYMQQVLLHIEGYPYGLSQAAVQAAIVVGDYLGGLQYACVGMSTYGSPDEAARHHLFTGEAIDHSLGEKGQKHGFALVEKPGITRLYAIPPDHFPDRIFTGGQVRRIEASDIRARDILGKMGRDSHWPGRAFTRGRGDNHWQCLSSEPTYR